MADARQSDCRGAPGFGAGHPPRRPYQVQTEMKRLGGRPYWRAYRLRFRCRHGPAGRGAAWGASRKVHGMPAERAPNSLGVTNPGEYGGGFFEPDRCYS